MIGCQNQSVLSLLVSFVQMLAGVSLGPGGEIEYSDVALTIAQMIQFNSACNHRKTGHLRHNADKETPLNIYIAFLVHSYARSRVLIDKLYDLGLCISYPPVLSTSTANSVCEKFDEEGLVCSPSLRKDVLTTFAVDNIDHNPRSRTADESWHGTAISATQHSFRTRT